MQSPKTIHVKKNFTPVRFLQVALLILLASTANHAMAEDETTTTTTTTTFSFTSASNMNTYSSSTSFSSSTTVYLTDVTLKQDALSITFAQNSAPSNYVPTWVSSASAIKLFRDSSTSTVNGNSMTITGETNVTITGMTITYSGSSYAPTSTAGAFSTGSSTTSSLTTTWTGSANSVTFTNDNSSGTTWYITTLAVTYEIASTDTDTNTETDTDTDTDTEDDTDTDTDTNTDTDTEDDSDTQTDSDKTDTAGSATEGTEGIYALVTDVSNLRVGNEITFVYETGNVAIGAETDNTSNSGAKFYAATNITLSDHQFTITDDCSVFALGTMSDYWLFINSEGEYLSCSSESVNYLFPTSSTSSYTKATIAIDSSSGDATVKFSAGSNNLLSYNSNAQRFACYSGVQNSPQIYKHTYSSVDVTISGVGYATLYYGSRALEIPDGVTAYTVQLEEETSATSGYKAVLTALSTSIIPAGEPVIIYSADAASSEEGKTYTFYFRADDSSTASSDNALKGTDTETALGEEGGTTLYYQLSLDANDTEGSLGFYWQANGGTTFTNQAHKAYLPIEQSTTGEAKQISIVFPDTDTDSATGISSLSETGSATPCGVYTLSGQKLGVDARSLPRGFYIIDGRKVLIP